MTTSLLAAALVSATYGGNISIQRNLSDNECAEARSIALFGKTIEAKAADDKAASDQKAADDKLVADKKAADDQAAAGSTRSHPERRCPGLPAVPVRSSPQ